ncbi:MAG: YIP1 family protein [Chloroflexi bacterium]|nr:MAG: YIP1 family protein [Chloroflexota bacterium]
MEAITTTFRQAIDALLLKESAFRDMRESPNPFVRGLTFIVSVALIVALVSIVGAVLFRLTAPDFRAIQDAIWQGMMRMPWVETIPEPERNQAIQGIRQTFDLGWQIARMFIPSITNALINVILSPIALVVGWLLYGFLAFVSARALGGKGRLDQTYGATALAAAPRMLGVVHVLPNVQTAGLGIWALICNYLAIKNTHELSPWRAFWATVIPFILLFLFAFGLAILGITIASFAVGGGS